MPPWMDYQQQECVIQFLMGLIESYTHTWTQILMMDPLHPIAKVFTLGCLLLQVLWCLVKWLFHLSMLPQPISTLGLSTIVLFILIMVCKVTLLRSSTKCMVTHLITSLNPNLFNPRFKWIRLLLLLLKALVPTHLILLQRVEASLMIVIL